MGKWWKLVNGKRVRTAAGVKHEYEAFQKSTKAKKARASRNKARRHAIAAGKAQKGDGKDVHHKNGNPMDDRAKNLSVIKASKNRAKREKSRLKGSKHKKWGRG